MGGLIVLLLAGALSAPSDAEAKNVYAAIWNDLQLNGVIGSGNWLASLWWNAGGVTHIRDLSCNRTGRVYQCSFTLKRDGGEVKVYEEDAPNTLLCDADFIYVYGELGVEHLPPPREGGHSRTTMTCRRPEQG